MIKIKCKQCEENPVIVLPESTRLCKSHFISYFEKKVRRTIRLHKLIDKKDKVVVALSGGKDSVTIAHILNQILKLQRRKLTAILVDEGIKGYRDKSIKDARKFCEEEKIELVIVSFKESYKKTLDKIINDSDEKLNSCTVCGVFRRVLLNNAAKKLNATKIATGHNLDDETQSFLMNQIRVNWMRTARLGPLTGVLNKKIKQRFVQRIKPLYFLSEKEVATYAFLKKFDIRFNECPYSEESFRRDVRDAINSLEEKQPGAKHGIVNSLMDILPFFKKRYKYEDLGCCELCCEPSKEKICNSCKLVKKLGLNKK